MTTLRSAGRGLLRVGGLLVPSTVGAALLLVPTVPMAAIGGIAFGALLLALIGGPRLAGRFRIARAACIAFGVGQLVPPVVGRSSTRPVCRSP